MIFFSRPCRIADKLKQLRIADMGLDVRWQLLDVKMRYLFFKIFVVWDMAACASVDDCRYKISRRICWLHVKIVRVRRTENWRYRKEGWERHWRWGRQILTVVTKKTKMGQLGERSVATAVTHRLWPLLSSPTQHIRVLAAAFVKTCYFRESSHIVPPLTPLSKAVDLSQPSLHTLLGGTLSLLEDILNNPYNTNYALRYLRLLQQFGEDPSLLKCVPFVSC